MSGGFVKVVLPQKFIALLPKFVYKTQFNVLTIVRGSA